LEERRRKGRGKEKEGRVNEVRWEGGGRRDGVEGEV
jgi:hypothetical protein